MCRLSIPIALLRNNHHHYRLGGGWSGAVIEDRASVTQSIICDGAVIKRGAVVPRGCIISYGAVVGENVVLPEFARISAKVTLAHPYMLTDTFSFGRSRPTYYIHLYIVGNSLIKCA